MEFLINININWPSDLPADVVRQISADERQMAKRLAESGHLVRMWRVPGRRENWGLWRASSPTEMHQIISGLPVWPYMQVQITALAEHPVDPGTASATLESVESR